jgi:hypothetical protein
MRRKLELDVESYEKFNAVCVEADALANDFSEWSFPKSTT